MAFSLFEQTLEPSFDGAGATRDIDHCIDSHKWRSLVSLCDRRTLPADHHEAFLKMESSGPICLGGLDQQGCGIFRLSPDLFQKPV